MDNGVRDIILNVKIMVAAGILIPEYEVMPDSYVCFIARLPNGRDTYYAGKMETFPGDIQENFIGLYLNETLDIYKIVGVYEIADRYK